MNSPIGRFTVLEPRIAFDAAAAATAAATQAAAEAQAGAAQAAQADAAPDAAAAGGTTAAPHSLSELVAADAADAAAPGEAGGGSLLVLDGRVARDGLVAEARAAGIEVVVLDPGRDGLAQVAEALAAHGDTSSLQVVGAAAGGEVRLGTTSFDPAATDGAAAELARIGAGLAAEGELTVYAASGGAAADGSPLLQEVMRAPAAELVALGDRSEFLLGDGGAADNAAAVARTDAAIAAAESAIGSYMASVGSAEELFAAFDGGGATASAEWLASATAFLQGYRNGTADVQVELRNGYELGGALAGFAAAGPDGRPVIYLNAQWAANAPAADVTEALVHEYGHYVDWAINGSRDTAGEEGDAFAARVLGAAHADDPLLHGSTDYGAMIVDVDGTAVEIEMAGNVFDVAGNPLNFNLSNATLRAGSGTNSSTVYTYANVITVGGQVIDAVVKIVSISNATVSAFDSPGNPYNNSGFLQPNLNITAAGGNVQYSISFILGGTYVNASNEGTAAILQNVYVNTYDLDGSNASNSGRQFTDFSDIGSYTLNSSATTKISVQTPSAGITRFVTTVGGNVEADPGEQADNDVRARVFYYSISSMTVRVGDTSATGIAYFALGFVQGAAFNTPIVTESPVTVNSVTVNEGSPYAVFTLTGQGGQQVKLSTTDGTAKDGVGAGETADYSPSLQYFDGTTWQNYTANTFVTIPAGGSTLLVRTAIINDTATPVYEGAETFTLTATNSSGAVRSGTGTIVDDGTGVKYPGTVTGGVPDSNTTSLDDDRTLSVSSVTVNEGSPYAVFTVTGNAGLPVTLAAASGGAAVGTDTGSQLQYLNGSTWTNYTSAVAIPAGGTLLVRLAITNDTATPVNEPDESFTLTASYTTGAPRTASGSGTIQDDGNGVVFLAGNTTSTPDTVAASTLDDDRPLTVTSVTVNEGSPFAVFTVGGASGQYVRLSTTDGTAVDGVGGGETADYAPALEYYNGSTWVSYTAGSFVQIPVGGTTLLVRSAISNDAGYEGAENFTLRATNTGGAAATGTGTIRDDGTGVKYPGTVTGGVPDSTTTSLDDDRTLAVSSVTVNEGSPYAVFTVTGNAGLSVTLAASSGTATVGTDTVTQLQYLNGSTWTDYSSAVAIPAGGALLVRVAINNDTVTPVYEGPESFTLTASYVAGASRTANGTGTIIDDGTGSVFLSTNTTSTPNAPGNPGYPAALDDDRTLSVSSVTVNEGSPYAVFTVTGNAGLPVTLAAASGGAAVGTDTGSQLQYLNGTTWTNYTSAVTIPAGGTLLVRLAITNDTATPVNEPDESFTLTASYTTGAPRTASGSGTIQDDGNGVVFLAGNTTSTPDTVAASTLDDDRPLTVTSVTVNEGSPYAVFTVGGASGQYVRLSTTDGTAVDGVGGGETADYAPALEYYNGSTWVTYAAGSFVQIPAGGTTLLVRSAISNDAGYEGAESFTLTATNTGGAGATGSGTIVDDGTGVKYPGTVTGGVPDSTTTSLDDDRALSVSSVTVNEGSPYAVFTVTGDAGLAVTLAAVSGGAAVGTDTGTQLQYLNGTSWTDYGSAVTLPAGGTLLVRIAITQDATFEGAESFTLTAAYASGASRSAEGTGTIVDDGTGLVFLDDATPGTPDTPVGPLDDDRTLSVSSVTVNEGSPWAVFTVSGNAGQAVTLVTADGTALIGTDTGAALEYYDGAAWVAYGASVTIPAGGTLLVRVAITQDTTFEGAESFTLTASYTTGAPRSAEGTGTIVDDGTGLVFLDDATPGTPDTPVGPLDDDRALAVSSVTVNEGSPFAVFTVSGDAGQVVTLATANGTALIGTDTGAALEYYDGAAWVAYGASVTLPAGGTLLVRIAITQDATFEGAESFTLTAAYASGASRSAEGTGTIVDDGTGLVFLDDATPGTPDTPVGPLDDDRTLSVSSVTVNEGSPWAVFTVSGNAGQAVTLVTADGTALIGTDTGAALEYYDGAAWVAYGASVTIPAGGTLLVRVAITQDTTFEGAESFTLTASYTTGAPRSAEGTGTIVDDGTGLVFLDDATPGTPDTPVGPLDDDRALAVSSVTVNEGSPFAVFTVSGDAGQVVTLATANGTALIGTDTGAALEYYDGAAWVAYGASVTLPASGTLLVRIAITQDATFEGTESFTLTAAYASGAPRSAEGTGTIVDDGTGLVFLDDATPGTPDTPVGPLDDDRALAVSSVTVNEGSPFAVFTVSGDAGQVVTLATANGTALIGTDTGAALEYYDGAAWVAYGASVTLPASGTLLVRIAITQDATFEGTESFTLTAAYASGAPRSAEGTGTIVDDGTGLVFLDDATPGTPDTPVGPLDDDRTLSVSSVTVNEGSPYAVFTVSGNAGQVVTLSTADGTALIGTDTGAALEYYDGAAWVAYGASVTIPAGGTLLVRVAITQDTTFEGAESFTLTASYTTGAPRSAEGTGTIVDDGTGLVFLDDATPGTPDTPVGPLDDDRALAVSSVTVNEGSPFAVFTVSGDAGQVVTLATANGTALIGTDTGAALEYYDGAAWVAYGASVTLPASGTLLVRIAITQDATFEGTESFTLTAAYASGAPRSAEGTGTIVDDGTGLVFLDDATPGTPDTPVGPLDDDRTLSVSSVTVNEGSPYAVFTVSGNAGQVVTLSTADGTALIGTDTGAALEYYDGAAWVAYGASVTLPAGGTLLVRLAITNDTATPVNEPDESFTLTASYTTGAPRTASGSGTIQDDGNGVVFLAGNTTSTPDTVAASTLDDDRPLTVTSVTVNEGSPFAVFTVGGASGQYVRLSTTDGTAVDGVGGGETADYAPALEYYNGSTWVTYAAGSFVQIPAGGTTLLVRSAISNDAGYEGAESFTLTATNTGGAGATGSGTIVDDGTGVKYPGTVTGGVPDSTTTSLDDDRALSVSSVTVNEGSPYAVFTVTGDAGQVVTLSTADGTALIGTDTGAALEYYDGAAWVAYGASVTLPAGGTLLVRLAITNDTATPVNEPDESFTLTASYTTGAPRTASGSGTIQDDGNGVVFLAGNTTSTPDTVAASTLDDDRPLTVTSVTVNEGSPFAVFTVGGASGQYVRLSTTDGTAVDGVGGGETADYAPALEYYNGSTWVTYAAGSFVQIPAGGTTLPVRSAISNDAGYEGAESFTLTATNTGGAGATGSGTIVDDGTGVKYPGTVTGGVPDSTTTSLDDDRALSVSSVTVNEGSPYAVFTVTGDAGQVVTLSTANGTALVGTDTGAALEYYDGAAWVAYGASVTLPASGTLLVRIAIAQDSTFEGAESFTLTAAYTTGAPRSAEGTGTIVDDGTGLVFLDDATPGTPDTPVGPLDDDRTLAVSSVTVNEGSPWAVFTVSGNAGQAVTLVTADGTALIGTDTGAALEYYDGAAWVAYGASVTIPAGGTLLVRVAITQDTTFEGAESFTLTASYTTGAPRSAEGTGTIVDDGTGLVFLDDATPGTPDTPVGPLDDDRALAVSSVTVNEGSPFAVFTVSGDAGQVVTLATANGTALIGTDTGAALEYYDGAAWVAYGASVTLPASGTLLVRIAITQDATFEGTESFTLTAAYASGAPRSAEGTGTIVDDGTGLVFLDDATPGTPDTPVGPLDDDRALAVSSVTVNEGSPFAVFTVSGDAGQVVTLATANGTALIGTDTGAALEYYDGAAWVAYGASVTLPASGTLLVRIAITQDATFEGTESFTLTAAYASGAPRSAEGTGTIVDDGTGLVFLDDATPGTPDTPVGPLDDDRTLSVSSVTVNEGSPYAVFTVSGNAGQVVTLSTADGTALIGTDTGAALEYYDGAAWVAYGASVTIPAGGTLLVRVAITQDTTFEGAESFTLTASYTTGAPRSAEGTGTIVDDGTGLVFLDDATPGTPDTPVGPLDDDRALAVSSVTVNEGSPFAVFTVSGDAGQVVTLATANGTALIGTDTGAALEYYDGAAWVAYGASVTLPASGTLLVRIAITQDATFEGTESFTLTAAYASGAPRSAEGTGTIVDDGTGLVFLDDATPGTPDTPVGPLDDDRALAVSSVTVNEGSPWAVFTVSGDAGQLVTLSTANGTALIGTDTGAALEYYDGAAWVAYGASVTLPAGGTLLVRLAITNDTATPVNEPDESFTLTASYTTGAPRTASGSGTIQDDGNGVVFLAGNTTSTPDTVAASTLDDDRPLTVTSVTVNEGSPYAVFTVGGASGQYVRLSTTDGTAVDGVGGGETADYAPALEYYNGSTWVTYAAGSFVQIPAGGTTLLVRSAISNDAGYEGAESFTLTATNTGGAGATGSGTIVDDGTGVKYPGTVTGGVPDSTTTSLDDDRVLSVSSVTVNEGSPYAVFTVSGNAGQVVTLSTADGTALIGTDTGAALEYYDGAAWVAYGASVTLPAGGTLLVRLAITNDTATPVNEPDESFTLTASYTTGAPRTASGTGTIQDDGNGVVFLAGNTTSTPDTVAASTLDDDRPLTVTSVTVNEGSPYAVFTVGGASGQYVRLSTTDGTAVDGVGGGETADYAPALEYYNGSTWVSYTAGSFVQIPAGGTTLLVRSAISNDAGYEGAESFTLTATNTGGAGATGSGTIVDDGTGVKYPGTVTGGVPDSTTTSLDDDRALAVSSVTVNEGSPYAVFTVTGDAGLAVTLAAVSGGAAVGTDTGTQLQYLNGTSWTDYGSAVTLPAGGTLLVRIAITQDATFEGAESFTLTASYTTGAPRSAEGTGTIVDDGTGLVFLDDATPGTPDAPAGPLDDDRTLSVSSVTVNEGSPFAVFTVSGDAGQVVTLVTANGTALIGTDTGAALEYYDGAAWVAYGASVTLPASGTLLVRIAITQDAIFEGAESFTLTAAYATGAPRSAEGTGTIVDDGTGLVFLDDATPGTPDTPVGPLDDDRALSVSSVTVNEGSPFAVFTVSGDAGQVVTLSTANGTALIGTDTGAALEYYDGAAWVAYGASVTLPASGTLLVRVAITQDATFEGAESFTLTASYTTGAPRSAEGTGTIVDDGTGLVFLDDATPGTPDTPAGPLDDDRALSVSSVTVNEGSPFAVFTVSGDAGQVVTLSTANGTAAIGTDTGAALEYYDGAAWVAYGASVTLPATGTLLVRVAITQDATFEGAESFTLTASYTTGAPRSAEGTGTIVDDGTGLVFLDDATPGTPDTPVGPLDDDRALAVSSVTVNEGSPWAVFTVSGDAGQLVTLSTANGTALIGTDTGAALEYYDGAAWVAYGASVTLPATGTLLVRVAITQDSTFEGAESFTLTAAYTTGAPRSAEGTGTIVDDGTGLVFLDDATPGTPDTPVGPLDDDRALAVSSVTVNEGSPYAVFTVSGASRQLVTLSVAGGTAELGTDTGTALEYFDGTDWRLYTPGSLVALGAGGTLQVRIAVVNDGLAEGAESFTLTATNTGGSAAAGTGTIVDDDGVLTVSSVTVNEASPWAVFTVSGAGGQLVTLGVASGTATLGIDTGTALDYFDGTAWRSYTPGSQVAIPAGGSTLLVRIAVTDDSTLEGPETFTLSATNSAGRMATGTGTITDDGSGTIFPGDGAPPPTDGPTDDRAPTVADVTVSETASHIVWTVTGAAGQSISLQLASGTATVGTDTGTGLEYFDGTSWQTYVPGATLVLPAGGTLQVRVALAQDALAEGAETVRLTATVKAGLSATGTATILDDAPPVTPPPAVTPPVVAPPTVEPLPPAPPAPPAAPIVTTGGLPPWPFRAEIGGGIGSPSPLLFRAESGDWRGAIAPPTRFWEIIPLGPSPAYVTGTALAAQSGNGDAWGRVPGWIRPSSTVLTFGGSLFDRPNLLPAFGSPAPILVSPLVDMDGVGSGGGGRLLLAREPGAAVARQAEETLLSLPPGIFRQTDRTASVTIEARMADGSAMPSWLQVDPMTGRVRLAPPADFAGVLEVLLIARDDRGHEARATYTITVVAREPQQSADLAPAATGDRLAASPADEILALFAPASPPPAAATDEVSQDGTPPAGRAGLGHMLALAALERSRTSLGAGWPASFPQ